MFLFLQELYYKKSDLVRKDLIGLWVVTWPLVLYLFFLFFPGHVNLKSYYAAYPISGQCPVYSNHWSNLLCKKTDGFWHGSTGFKWIEQVFKNSWCVCILGGFNPAGIYLFKANNRNTRARCEICLELSITTPEQRQWGHSGVFIVDFEHVSHLALVLLLLTLNMYMPTGNKRKEASSNKSLFQHRGRLGFTKKDVYINPSHPDLRRREKINLNFYFHTSLWCLWRPQRGVKIKI